jgi:hypothetical protein
MRPRKAWDAARISDLPGERSLLHHDPSYHRVGVDLQHPQLFPLPGIILRLLPSLTDLAIGSRCWYRIQRAARPVPLHGVINLGWIWGDSSQNHCCFSSIRGRPNRARSINVFDDCRVAASTAAAIEATVARAIAVALAAGGSRLFLNVRAWN